jgi:hypothetical protein
MCVCVCVRVPRVVIQVHDVAPACIAVEYFTLDQGSRERQEEVR